jgi:ParB-like chromosome segregation protein Spo0J
MSEICNVPLRDIKSNPHRHLDKYPYVEEKIDALMRSMNDVGFWEGVIGRRVGNHVEIAFGHHRIEAARRIDSTMAVPVILRDDMDDEKMLQFMGRENGEDYNADFTVMLETWEAAAAFLDSPGNHPKAIDVARLLGWTQERTGGGTDILNKVALACSNASEVLSKGVMDRQDFAGVNVKAAREVATTAKKRVKQFEGSSNLTDKQKKARVESVGKSAKKALEGVRKGDLTAKDAGALTDTAIREEEQEFRQDQMTMDRQLDQLASSVRGMLAEGVTVDRLKELARILPNNKRYMNSADVASLERLQFELRQLAKRATKRADAIDFDKIVDITPHLREITHG